MGSPTLIGTQTQELALADGVSSIITNVGSNPVYLGSYDGISDTNYEYLLNAGATIEWNGYTRIFAVTGPNAPSSIQIFKNSNFMFDGYATGKAISEQAYRTMYASIFTINPDDGSAAESYEIAVQVPQGAKSLEWSILPYDTNYLGTDYCALDYTFTFLDNDGMLAFNSYLIENGMSVHPNYPALGSITSYRVRCNGVNTSVPVTEPAFYIPVSGPWLIVTITRANHTIAKTLSIDPSQVINGLIFSNKPISWPWVIQDVENVTLVPNINNTMMPLEHFTQHDAIGYSIAGISTPQEFYLPYRFGYTIEYSCAITHTGAGSGAAAPARLQCLYDQIDGVTFNAPLASNDIQVTANRTEFFYNKLIHPPAPIVLNLSVGTSYGNFTADIIVRYQREYG